MCLWNALPREPRLEQLLPVFRHQQKTFLFIQALSFNLGDNVHGLFLLFILLVVWVESVLFYIKLYIGILGSCFIVVLTFGFNVSCSYIVSCLEALSCKKQ